ncbi:MAG: hypothetical protein A2V90_00420 [Gammaproteobacteria bacterium RBG_16_57_12]|nr:MAG: hypothetical protein A2V90_00420 [Gammaproteobacteria bacterium RBG_16_57_12]
MTVRVKVASSAKELEDVFWVRHEVYATEEGYFQGAKDDKQMIVDEFDALPMVANIIAYCNDEPVATLRINLDSGQGLPPEEYYDFSAYRQRIAREWFSEHGTQARFGSAGMLAIRKPWRHRRDVIRAMFKMGAGIGHAWEGTHIIASINAKTAEMYKRIGFEALGEQQWVVEIGEYILPMASTFRAFYYWAFGDLLENNSTFLNLFSSRFQRLLLGPDDIIFRENEQATEAYVIDSGLVRIFRTGSGGNVLTLGTLGRGELFGELSLIDTKPRSASAASISNSELIVLDREDFISELQKNPARTHEILQIFAERLRRADELAVVLANGSPVIKMEYALNDLRRSAITDGKRPSTSIARISPLEVARNAGIDEADVREFLNRLMQQGVIEYNEHQIRFMDMSDAPSASDELAEHHS